MAAISLIAEQRIREACERGAFDSLPGAGKPLELEDDSHIPEDLRDVYKRQPQGRPRRRAVCHGEGNDPGRGMTGNGRFEVAVVLRDLSGIFSFCGLFLESLRLV